jgi:hypothetical protein
VHSRSASVAIGCFDPSTGASATINPAFAGHMATTANQSFASFFRMPGSSRTIYSMGYGSPSNSPLCFDFAANSGAGGKCAASDFTPGWSAPNMKDYGYAVDPAAPERCVLGLGHAGQVWRFANDGSFNQNGCTQKIIQTLDFTSFYCGSAPDNPTWQNITFVGPRPSSLSGGTITISDNNTNHTPVAVPIGSSGTSSYAIPPGFTNSSPLTVQIVPQWSTSGAPQPFQIKVTFTTTTWPQICYQAQVSACGPVSNSAAIAGTHIGPVPLPFTETANFSFPNGATGPTCDPGLLKICKVAGLGIAIGTPFTFSIGSSTVTVPAGAPPGGTCVAGPQLTVGSSVTVTEAIPAGDTVSSIVVAPPGSVIGTPNLAGGSVDLTIGSGVTVVTYTDKRTGFLEICKNGNVQGNFTFMLNPGNLGPFIVPAGACTPPIEVLPGQITITETTPGAAITACATFPAGQQVSCVSPNSVVSVVPGSVSSETVSYITNK